MCINWWLLYALGWHTSTPSLMLLRCFLNHKTSPPRTPLFSLSQCCQRTQMRDYLASSQKFVLSASAANWQDGPFMEIATSIINWTGTSDGPLCEMNTSNLCQQVTQHIALAISSLSLLFSLQKKQRIKFSAVTYNYFLSLYDSFIVTLFEASLEKSHEVFARCSFKTKINCMNESFLSSEIGPPSHSEATRAV